MKHVGKGCKAGDEASWVSYIPISASAQGPSWCSSVPLSYQLVTTEGMGVTSGNEQQWEPRPAAPWSHWPG